MTIKIINSGKEQGQLLYEIELSNLHGMKVFLINYGASIKSIQVPTSDGYSNLVVNLPKVSDYLKQRTYFGATVGRVAGRLPQTVWNFGQHNYQLEDNDLGRHKHGGNLGLDQRAFSIKAIGQDYVTFGLIDYAGSNGYPGNLTLLVTYHLDEFDSLSVSISGTSDAWTLFNPTNHTYFALDGIGTNIFEQWVSVAALAHQPVAADLIPREGWQPIRDTIFDLSQPTLLKSVLTSSDPQIQQMSGLNHAFLLDSSGSSSVVLESKVNQRRVTMKTDAQSVILYSGNHFENNGVVPDVPKYGGITMEAQTAPEVGSIWDDIALAPNEPFERSISWHFDY